MLDAIYASPMGRTMETALIIGASHRLEPQPEPATREIDYGHWEGLTRREVEGTYPGEYGACQEDPLTTAPAGGESGSAVFARALPVMRCTVQGHCHGSVLVVAHKGTNRLLLRSLLGFDVRGYRDRLEQSPAGLTILDFAIDGRARPRLCNNVSHDEDMPARVFQERLSRWWTKPD